jgi:hypothetical protein
MKNVQLTIGTKVSYTRTSLTSEPVDLQSVVKGFFDGYVCLENGDKMSRSALTVIEDNTEQQIKSIVLELNKCLPNAKKAQCGFKVRVGKELLVSSKVKCITIVGRCHVELLEKVTQSALDMYASFGYDSMQHTIQHNIKLFFRD